MPRHSLEAGWHAPPTPRLRKCSRGGLPRQRALTGRVVPRTHRRSARGVTQYRAGLTLIEQVDNLKGQVRVFEALGLLDSAERAARLHDRQVSTGRCWSSARPGDPGSPGARGDAVSEARTWAYPSGGERQCARRRGGAPPSCHAAHWGAGPLTRFPRLSAAESLAVSLNLTDELIEARRLHGQALAQTETR